MTATEIIRKEFSVLFDRLNSLPPSERESLINFLKVSIPVSIDQPGTSVSESHVASLCSNEPSTFVHSSSNDDAALTGATEWVSPFILEDTLNFSYFVQTQEKSTNTPTCDPSFKRSRKEAENKTLTTCDGLCSEGPQQCGRHNTNGNNSNASCDTNFDQSVVPFNRLSMLHCPVCRREFTKWVEMEKHLYVAHTTTVPPVCWRCRGVFHSHAVLLAHECLDWGRANLPCQAILNGSSVAADEQRAFLAQATHLEFPRDGVFLRRRCGLCPRSQLLFTTYQSFKLHQKTVHFNEEKDSQSSRNHKRGTPETATLTDENASFYESSHVQSEDAFRSIVRRLFDHFRKLQDRQTTAEHRRGRREFFTVDGAPTDPPASSASPQLTMTLLAAQRARFKSGRSSPVALVDIDSTVLSDASDNHDNHITKVSAQSMQPARSYYSLTRLVWHRKHQKPVIPKRKRNYQHCTNPYNKYYKSKIGRFVCHCCLAVFRAASRLKAHHLFKHGHVPENLDEFSPTSEVLPSGTKRGLDKQTTADSDEFHEGSELSSSKTTDSVSQVIPVVQFTSPSSGSPHSDVGMVVKPTDVSKPSQTLGTGKNARRRKQVTYVNSKDARTVPSFQRTTSSSDHSDTSLAASRVGPPFSCQFCSRTYCSVRNVQRHEKQTHWDVYQFFCGYCEFRTNERCALDEHLARHFRIKPFFCEFCDARFIVRRELTDHIAFKHKTERNFKCPDCAVTFKTPGTLSRHRKIHGSRTRHACELCTATFTRLSNLKRHTHRSHRPKRPTHKSTALITHAKSPASRKTSRSAPIGTVDQSSSVFVPSVASPSGSVVTESYSQEEETDPAMVPFTSVQPCDSPCDQHFCSEISECRTETTQSVNTSVVGTVVTPDSNLLSVNTIFMPYLTHSMIACDNSSIAQSTSSFEYATADSCVSIPHANLQPSASSLAQTVYPSVAVTSLFPLQLSDQLSPTSLFAPPVDGVVEPNTWPSSGQRSLYLLTATDTPDIAVKTDGSCNNLTVVSTSTHQHLVPSDLAGTQMAFADEHDSVQNTVLGSTMLGASYPLEAHLNPVLEASTLPQTNDISVTHIWRPIECDLSSKSSTSCTVDLVPLHLISPFTSESDSQGQPIELLDQGSYTKSSLMQHCSPRFPSPVSADTLSPHATGFSSPPATRSPTFAEYCPDSQSDAHSSFSMDMNSSTVCSQSNLRVSNCPEHLIFSTESYSHQRSLPFHMTCAATSMHSQFLSPMWSSSTPVETFHSYPASLVAPNTPQPADGSSQCSNFSVGYLIGQNPPYGSINSADSSVGATLPTVLSNTHYYNFNPSTSS